MAQIPNIQSYVDLARSRINAYLLPDTCNIYPVTRTKDGSGGWLEVPGTCRQYNSSNDVPCRLDPTRQYLNLEIFNQEVTVDDFILKVPFDASIEVDDNILHQGIIYQIRKLSGTHSWNSVKIALVVSVK